MIIDLPIEPGDDPTFLLAVSAIVAAVAHDELPTEVRVIRVDNWFDHKWLGFSGKGRVYFDTTWPRNHPCVGDAVTQWYASFLGGPRWRLGRVKGINRDHLDAILTNPAPSPH